ncbi:hypothetical protein BGV70_13555 [Burkholderia ubonensis]|nr:hypothetical protein WJ29_00845 [Burkholderia ubonensis]OJA66975.1 hypothetical protein BGV70_13555 [Burkholderia ubonensis]
MIDGLLDSLKRHIVVQKLHPQRQVNIMGAAIISPKCMLLNSLAQIVECLHHGKQAHVRQDQVVLVTARVKRQSAVMQAEIM